jgi:hypothetical protein
MRPGDCNVTVAELPGVIEPVAKAWLSAVASCVVTSLFTQVIVLPTATMIGLGENAVVVRLAAPRTIETLIPEAGGAVGLVGAGVGVGAADGSVPPPPHAAIPRATNTTGNKRNKRYDKECSLCLMRRLYDRPLPRSAARTEAGRSAIFGRHRPMVQKAGQKVSGTRRQW